MLEASRISENSWSLAGLRATHSGYFTQGRFTIGSQSDPDTSLGTNFFRDQRTHAPITKIKSLYLNRVACVQLAKKVFRGGAEGMLWSKGRRDLELRTSGYQDRWNGVAVELTGASDLIFQSFEQRTPEKETGLVRVYHGTLS